ncbi:MAG TPA: ROK family transcriptional regulator [Chloroflexi bacterium]|nr:ROK family transcriptional regulator [Chloroflexota bacterium]
MPRFWIANRQLIRAINRSTVLNIIKADGPISRTEIGRLSGLSPATVSEITADLIAEGLIYEKAAGDSTGGRPPILLALNHDAAYVVGLKLAERQISAALTDIEATILCTLTVPVTGMTVVERAVEELAGAVERVITESSLPRERVTGVGIGLAGVIDAERGLCRYSPILGWRDVPLEQLVEEQIGIPVRIDNDVNTLAMAEKWFGAGQGVDDFLVVTVGRGVGLGIVVNGQFYRGTRGGGGEFGHTVMDPHGPACDCGKRGCLEAYVADPALVRAAREAVLQGKLGSVDADELTVEQVTELAREGDETLREILAQAGRMLGMGIANLVNIFNPALIIISGEGVRAGDLLFGPMREAVAQYAFDSLVEDTEIVVQEWGDEAWAWGAASLVLQEIYKSPIHARVPAVSLSMPAT